MEYTREVTLDFSLHEVVPFVRVKQWDASTRSILVYLKKDGETYIPESDITIMFRCEKPDKRGVMLDSQFIDEELQRTLVVDNRDGTVTIELVDQCTVVPGKCYCDLCFIKDDEIISTLPFVLDVRPSPDIAKRATSTDDFRTLANAIAGGIPSVEITEITGGHRMAVTAKNGTQTFDVMDGEDGKDGTDGYSPVISTSSITGGHRVSVQDKTGTKSFDVMNGTDGFSPTVSTAEITGGHRLSIQDKSGTKTVDVMDGEKGDKGDGFTIAKTVASVSDLPATEEQGTYYNVGTQPPYRIYMYEVGTGWIDQGTIQGPVGQGVPTGGTAGQVLKKKTATDYDAEWADESDGGADAMVVTVTYNSQTSKNEADKTFAEIYAAYQSGALVYAMYGSYAYIYNLFSASSSAIEFYRMDVSYDHVQRYYIRISSNNSVSYSSYNMSKTTLPSPLHRNPILSVKYDDSETPAKYVIYAIDNFEYMYELFSDDGYAPCTYLVVTLQYIDNQLNMWGQFSNAKIEEYKLTDAYTTYQEDPDGVYWDDMGNAYSFFGHLVFSKVDVADGQVKLKQFTVENNFQHYMDTATVTYSETSLGQAPSASGVSF